MRKNLNQNGFTLIELLVVISIIGFLATASMVVFNSARQKARDTARVADFKQIQTALNLFYDANNRMPNNYNPCCGACEGSTYYNQSMQELVTAKFLGAIPKSPGGIGSYCYYNYGANNSVGAIMVTSLEAAPNTTAGIYPSCRPWAPGVNWCDQSSSRSYCLCTLY